MKTNQEMVRYIDNFLVIQRTSDGYFDGSELLRQWNGVEGNSQRKMDEFLFSKETSQFIGALIEEERNNSLGENSPKIDNQVFKKSRVKKTAFKKIRFPFGSMESLRNFAVLHFYIHIRIGDFLCPILNYCLQYKQRFLRTYSPQSRYGSVATWRKPLLSSYIINF